MQILVRLAVALVVCLAVSPVVQAKELPVVGWSPNLFSVADGAENHLLDDASRRAITAAVTAKLHDLQQAGRLPFQLKEVDEETNAEFQAEAPIGLIPIVIADRAFDTSYRIDGMTYYKSLVVSAVDLAFCSPEGTTGSWRVLGTVPLRCYGVLGADASQTEPIPALTKEQEYERISKMAVARDMDFSGISVLWEDLANRSVVPETWQVTEVQVPSVRAQEVFGEDLPAIRNLIGVFFTSSYARHTQHIVYPARTEAGWKKDVEQNLYTLQINSPTGSAQVVTEKPRHEIHLEFTGLAQGTLQLRHPSKVQKDVGYKVWLKRTLPVGDGDFVTKTAVRQFSQLDTEAVQLQDADVFTELLLSAAQELGNKKDAGEGE